MIVAKDHLETVRVARTWPPGGRRTAGAARSRQRTDASWSPSPSVVVASARSAAPDRPSPTPSRWRRWCRRGCRSRGRRPSRAQLGCGEPGHLGGGEPEGGADPRFNGEDGPLSKVAWRVGAGPHAERSAPERRAASAWRDRRAGRPRGGRPRRRPRSGRRPARRRGRIARSVSTEDGTGHSHLQTPPQRSGVVGGEEEAAAGLRRRAGLDPEPSRGGRQVECRRRGSCSRRASARLGRHEGGEGGSARAACASLTRSAAVETVCGLKPLASAKTVLVVPRVFASALQLGDEGCLGPGHPDREGVGDIVRGGEEQGEEQLALGELLAAHDGEAGFVLGDRLIVEAESWSVMV